MLGKIREIRRQRELRKIREAFSDDQIAALEKAARRISSVFFTAEELETLLQQHFVLRKKPRR